MINPQVVKTPPKYSFRNLKKYLPQLKEMARKEGIAKMKKHEKDWMISDQNMIVNVMQKFVM